MNARYCGTLFNTSTDVEKKVRPGTAARCFNTSTDKVKMEKRPTVSLYLNELLD